jgi:hypothetical protein
MFTNGHDAGVDHGHNFVRSGDLQFPMIYSPPTWWKVSVPVHVGLAE